MFEDLDSHWRAADACLDRILEVPGPADESLPGITAEPLWSIAADLMAAMEQARPAARSSPAADLRRLEEVFWSQHDKLTAALQSAIQCAVTAQRAVTARRDELADAGRELQAIRPGAAQAADRFSARLQHEAGARLDRGQVLLRRLGDRSFSPATQGSLASRLGKMLGRDTRRCGRTRPAAESLAARLAATSSPELAAEADALSQVAGRQAAELASQLWRSYQELISFDSVSSQLSLDQDLAPIADWSPAPALPSLPDIGSLIAVAARTSVRPLTARDRWWRRLRTLNSLRADFGVLFGRPGYLTERAAITDNCARAWRRAIASWQRAALENLSAQAFREFLAALDRLPGTWQRTLDQHDASARTELAAATAIRAELEQVAQDLAATHRAWLELHAARPGGVSTATRGYLHELVNHLRSADRPATDRPETGRPADDSLGPDLAALARDDPELRLPVIAPMKAGKSTLLSALLGVDIVPRRAQVMTALPTRFIPVPPVQQAEPRLTLAEDLVAGHEHLLDQLTRQISGQQLAALAASPHLQVVARRLMNGDRVRIATEHAGAQSIRSVLTWLHDTVRLATVLLPAEATEMVATWEPEATVPVPGFPPARAEAGQAAGQAAGQRAGQAAGRLVLIDTPGPGEAAAAPVFGEIVRKQLANAHGCLIVVDFAQIFGAAEAAVAELVAEYASTLEPDAITVAVNRIDQRRHGDLGEREVLASVRQLFSQPGWAGVPVIETAAATGLAAAEYCDRPDEASRTALLRVIYPVRMPSRLPPDPELARLAEEIQADSGLTKLRERLIGDLQRAVPALALRQALTRARRQAAQDTAQDTAAIDTLISDANWAAQLATSLTWSNS